MPKPEKHILVCMRSRPADDPKGSCATRGSQAIVDAFASELGERELWKRFKLTTTSCLGICENGPGVLIYPEGVMYQKVTKSDVVTIIEQHLLNDSPVEELKASAEDW